MTQKENGAGDTKWIGGGEHPPAQLEIALQFSERTKAVNHVGSAMVHQLTEPLTALRLYVGELKENCGRLRETAEMQNDIQVLVQGAFQETERLCAMMKLIADGFEEPLHPETSAALCRDAINWWSQGSSTEANRPFHGRGPARPATSPTRVLLTPREREVLDHISQGCSSKQGAVRMRIGSRTFEGHRARLMQKLGAKNAADLVRIALTEYATTS